MDIGIRIRGRVTFFIQSILALAVGFLSPQD